jgi:hypothetical protein
MVTSRMLERRGVGKERRIERKWFESLMCEGRDSIINHVYIEKHRDPQT